MGFNTYFVAVGASHQHTHHHNAPKAQVRAHKAKAESPVLLEVESKITPSKRHRVQAPTVSRRRAASGHWLQDVSNEHYTLTFDETSGHLSNVLAKDINVNFPLDQTLLWWNSSDGHNVLSGQASGAYIFRPNGTEAFAINSGAVKLSTQSGNVYVEVRQEFAPWAIQIIRLFAGANDFEVEYQIGPIPIDDDLGKEIVTRWSTSLATNSICYTDANGREMRKRVRDHRDTWDYNVTEPIAGNYYPINSAAYIQDASTGARLTAVTDRSQGGASLKDGQLEIMLHRRTLYDDSRGVGEPISEPGDDGKGLIIRTKHRMIASNAQLSSALQRATEAEITFRPVSFFSALSSHADIATWTQNHVTSWQAVEAALPPNVHLLTLHPMTSLFPPSEKQSGNTLLLRLAHVFEVGEDSTLSQPVTLDLTTIFKSQYLNIASAVEMQLTANKPLAEVNKLQWTTDSASQENLSDYQPLPIKSTSEGGIAVTLQPQEIRTFMVTLA